MRNSSLTLTLMLIIVSAPLVASGQDLTLQTPIARYVVVDVIPRTGSSVFGILDRQTGKIHYHEARLPKRKITISKRTWDPIAGRYREIVGYDWLSLPVYRDEADHSHVVYWVTEKDQFPTASEQPFHPLPSPPQPPPIPCYPRVK